MAKEYENEEAKGRRILQPAIPYERPKVKKLERGEFHNYKLRTVPGDSSSPIYELSVPFFGAGTPEEWIRFHKNVQQVFVGQDVTTGPTQYALARSLLRGDALTVFDASAATHGAQTVEHFKLVMSDICEHVFPAKAVQTQKRYMRRYSKMPAKTTTKEFVARIQEMNEYLVLFPSANGVLSTPLIHEDLMDVLEYSLPDRWRQEMTRQNFQPTEESIKSFVEYCTRLESYDKFNRVDHKTTKSSRHGDDKESKREKRKGSREIQNGFYCELHGPNKTHNSKDCYSRKAKKQRTLKDNSKKQYDQELHVLIAKSVKKALKARSAKKKELHTLGKFRDMAISESEESNESDGNAINKQMVTFHSDDESPKKAAGPFDSSESESESESE